MIPIPDIRERNDRPKDRQPKHQVTSTVQRQMVQKFVKELNDSAKQPDRSDSAECTATEQVETTAREIVHEAIQFPRRVLQRPDTKESTDSSTETRPPHTPKPTHQRADAPRTRPEPQHPQSTPAAVPQDQAEKAEAEKAAAELAQKKENLRQYALSSKMITEAEVSEGGNYASLIENLDETGIKSVIAERCVEAAKKAPAEKKIETSEVHKPESIKLNLNETKYNTTNANKRDAWREYLGK